MFFLGFLSLNFKQVFDILRGVKDGLRANISLLQQEAIDIKNE